jgi:hypothetical protein
MRSGRTGQREIEFFVSSYGFGLFWRKGIKHPLSPIFRSWEAKMYRESAMVWSAPSWGPREEGGDLLSTFRDFERYHCSLDPWRIQNRGLYYACSLIT